MSIDRRLLDDLSPQEWAYVQRRVERLALPGTPIRPHARTEAPPLSYAQQRMWLLDQLYPDNAAYVMPDAFRMSGTLDVTALTRALNALVARHETLRTTFRLLEGIPRQVIAPDGALPLATIEWRAALRGVTPERRNAALQYLAGEEVRKPFDLARGPLVRAQLVALADDEHVLLFAAHHIISDGWSVGILVRELAALYHAYTRREPSPLPDLPIQYADFSVWQRDWLASEAEPQLRYWRERLQDLPSLELLPDFARPAVQTFRGSLETLMFPSALRAELTLLGQRTRTTLFMTLLAGFALLLSRLTRQEDIVLGSPVANRTRAELEGLVGLFVNTLIMRVDLSGDPTVTDLISRVREMALGAFAHQDLPFDRLVDDLRPTRNLNENPLCQVLFVLQNAPSSRLELDDLIVTRYELELTTTHFDLEAQVFERDDTLRVDLFYSVDLFEAATVRRLLNQFQTILTGMCAAPLARVSALPLAGEAERRHLSVDVNATAVPYPSGETIHGVFEAQARLAPDAVALEYGGEHVTYGELNARAGTFARRLRQVGVRPDQPVGMLAERSIGQIVGLLAILKAGGAYLPLDPSYPADRLRAMIAQSRITSVVCEDHLGDVLGRDLGLQIIPLSCGSGEADEEVGGWTSAPLRDPNAIAYVVYTSGSTGVPTAVAVSHRNVLRLVFGADYAHFGPDVRLLHLAPLSLDLSTFEIWGALLHGGCCALFPERIPTATTLGRVLKNHRITTLLLTTALFNAIVDSNAAVFADIQELLVGGDVLSVPHIRRAQGELPDTVLISGYGPTETTTFATCYRIPRPLGDVACVPIGSPIGNTQVYVLDRGLTPVPIGIPGEVYISGDGLARGYQVAPGLTAASFVPDPFTSVPGARMYRTGDLVRWRSDRVLEYLRRTDDQVKIRGFRINPAEIETVLRRHAAVRDAAVVAHGTTSNDRRLAAYVVAREPSGPAEGGDPSAARIARWQRVYDAAVYADVRRTDAASSGTFNTGWYSTYTQLPLSAEAMAEQVEQSVARILRRRPQRLLEIGCGTGLLLFRLAPQCERYVATDFSAVALEYVGQQLPEALKERVELQNRVADQFGGWAPRSFDAVILNSTIQYFPDINYLLRVLEGAMRVTRPGGTIFIGDVRNFTLLETFHIAVQLAQAHDHDSVAQLRRRIAEQIQREQELLIDPAFFHAIRAIWPQISEVRIELKRGRHVHELTQFRFDATLTIDGRHELPSESASPTFEWSGENLTIDDLRDRLVTSSSEQVILRAVPNARVSRLVNAHRLLAAERPTTTVAEIRTAAIAGAAGIDPEALWRLGDELRYSVDVSWYPSRPDGSFDVTFTRADRETLRNPQQSISRDATDRPWSSYANGPRDSSNQSVLAAELHRYVAERLPEYMVPASFVLLDALPLTSNGKLHRAALPMPVESHSDVAQPFVPPRSGLESIIAEIWRQILGVDRVGAHDNFFQIGGHSLSATQIVSQVREVLEVEVPLRLLFQFPTLVQFAEAVGRSSGDAEGGADEWPIMPAGRDRPLPLSFAQERLWLLDRLGVGGAYHIPVALRVVGPLDASVLDKSVNEVVRRHESLRTRFALNGDLPVQIVERDSRVIMAVHDLSGQVEASRSAQLQTIAAAEAEKAFNLEQGPVLRMSLVKIGELHHVVLLTIHHIAVDGWSLGILMRELTTAYAAFARGRVPSFPQLRVQYADFAVWQRERLSGPLRDRLLGYWTRRLAGAPPVLRLPLDRPRPAGRTYRGATIHLFVSNEITEGLDRIARACNATLFMTLLSAFGVLLWRHSGQSDLCIGTPVANRNHAEVEPLIGFFVNTVVLRIQLANHMRFPDLVEAVRDEALAAYAHQDLPFEQLVEALNPERDENHSPLFQILFALQNAPIGDIEMTDIRFEPLPSETHTSKFDLALDVMEHERELEAVFEYSTELFDRTTIERLASQFKQLLTEIVFDPDRPVSNLRLLSDAETDQFLHDLRFPVDPRVPVCALQRMVEEQAARRPAAMALEAGDGTLTYGELNAKANQVARWLRAHGVATEAAVAVRGPASAALWVAMVATLKAGGTYVPVDPAWPAARVAWVLRDAQVRAAITSGADAATWPVDLPVLDLRTPETLAAWGTENLDVPVDPRQLAYLLYTSGSTGTPKGVMVPHFGILNLAMTQAAAIALNANSRVAQCASCGYDASIAEAVSAWKTGATLVVLPPEAVLAGKGGPLTVATLVPSLLATAPHGGLNQIETILAAGEPLTGTLVRQWTRTHRLLNAYGPTEATVCATIGECGGTGEVTIGRPLANTQVYVVDESLRLVPPGVVGELCVGGCGVARGYVSLPDLTAAAFVPNPFGTTPGARMYRTGDWGRYRPTGEIQYLGRRDEQVKVQGVRIELGEVEGALRSHPQVVEAAVAVWHGDGEEPRLVGYVVGHEPELSGTTVRAWLAERLPRALVPTTVMSVEMLPRTSSGKVDRRALPAPVRADAAVATTFVAPRTPTETLLAALWRDVLGVERIGTSDNFFDAGGHSLKAMQLAVRVQAAFGVDVSPQRVFEAPTVAALAKTIEQLVTDDIVRLHPDESSRIRTE